MCFAISHVIETCPQYIPLEKLVLILIQQVMLLAIWLVQRMNSLNHLAGIIELMIDTCFNNAATYTVTYMHHVCVHVRITTIYIIWK